MNPARSTRTVRQSLGQTDCVGASLNTMLVATIAIPFLRGANVGKTFSR